MAPSIRVRRRVSATRLSYCRGSRRFALATARPSPHAPATGELARGGRRLLGSSLRARGAGSPRSRRRRARSWLHTPTLVSGRGCGEPGDQPEELAAKRAQGGTCPTPPRSTRSGSAAKNSSLGREDARLGQELFRSHLVRFNPGIPDAELAHDRPPCSKALTRSTPGVKGNRDANERLRVDSATWQFHARWFGWLATGEGGSATGESEPTRDAGQSGPRPCWASYGGARRSGGAPQLGRERPWIGNGEVSRSGQPAASRGLRRGRHPPDVGALGDHRTRSARRSAG
jgi:hypothetical protein